MTNEEAWKRTKGYLYDVLSGEEADEIINALESSRDIEEIEEIINCDANTEIKLKMISSIIHSKPHYFKTSEQQPCEDCISRKAALDQARDYGSNTYLIPVNSVKVLPPVVPQQKIGHWIDLDEKSALCSCCYKNNILYGDFCKWCGAIMIKPNKEN